MKYPVAILAAALALPHIGCKSKPQEEVDTGPAPVVPAEIQKNRLADEPSAFLMAAADSPVNWQPWSPEVLEHAQAAQRMIFVVAGSARYAGCFETIDALSNNPALAERINKNYVPVLTDIDLNRETSLMAYNLSAESKVNVAFPFLMLLSPEGNPVTWHPVQFETRRDIHSFFDNSLEVIGRLWSDSPEYVTDDSAKKAEYRRMRLPLADVDMPDEEERKQAYRSAMRRLESFYDEDVNSMAGSGGLFPFGILDMLALATQDESISTEQRTKFAETLRSFSQVLIQSSMIDILDGGVHSSRRGRSWNLVMGRRECSTQARASRIFARIHQLGDYPGALEAAIGATRYAEERFRTADGLFSLSEKPNDTEVKSWLWTTEQVSSVLNDQEFEVWKALSDLKDIGNLPSEADPNRNFFRLNALYQARSMEEVATITSMPLEQVESLIESGRKKLKKARDSRMNLPEPDPTPSALASFRMTSAYAALYTATGDSTYLDKAVELGTASRKHFLRNRFLNERPDAEPEGASDGRTFSYAIAVQAGLDVGAITLDDQWYLWAQDLTTLLAEHFVSEDGRLMEVREVSKVVDIDYEDRLMVFDDSSTGVVRLNLQRLKALGFQTPPALAAWLTSVPNLEKFPVVFTDSLAAISHHWNHQLLHLGPETSEEQASAITALPLQLFPRRRSDSNGVTVQSMGGEKTEITTVEEIRNLLKNP